MSAIAALWRFNGAPAGDDVARMASALRPFGRDRAGTLDLGDKGLAALLTVRAPEDAADRQPLRGAGGRYALVADVFLTNRDEVLDALDVAPIRRRSMADCAVVMAAVERWGLEAALPRLAGPFALALWDQETQRLICTRDALGPRPLYYHRARGHLAVATVLPGLFALPDVPKDLDDRRLARRMIAVAGTEVMFKDIHAVPPGHLLVADASGAVTFQQWWAAPAPGSIRPRSEADCAEQARDVFDRAVRGALRSTGGVVSHLSSGCDSGVVTSFAATALAEQGQRLPAYTAIPEGGGEPEGLHGRPGNEAAGAAALAERHPNVDHILHEYGSASPFDTPDSMMALMCQPLSTGINNAWIFGIARHARERGARVVLTGQMGNFTVSYNGMMRLPTLLRSGRLLTWGREMVALARTQPDKVLHAASTSVTPFLSRQAWGKMQQAMGRPSSIYHFSAISPEFMGDQDPEALLEGRGWLIGQGPRVDGHAARLALLQMEMQSVYVAINAATGVEHRDPTADKRVVEFCLGLSEEWFLSAGRTKRLLHLMAGDRLPARTLDPSVKRGYQGISWHVGLTRDRHLVRAELERLDGSPMARRLLDLPRLRRLVDDWPQGGWQSDWTTIQYRTQLERGLEMGRFIRLMEGGNR